MLAELEIIRENYLEECISPDSNPDRTKLKALEKALLDLIDLHIEFASTKAAEEPAGDA